MWKGPVVQNHAGETHPLCFAGRGMAREQALVLASHHTGPEARV